MKAWQRDNQGASVSAFEDELRAIQTFAALKPAYKILIYIAANFEGTTLATLNAEVVAHKPLLVAFAKTGILQRQTIAAVEWFCGTYKPPLIKFFPAILKQLFDEDVVEEDIFLEWYQDPLVNGKCADPSD